MSKKAKEIDEIKISFVEGGRSLDHQMLKGCYFYPDGDTGKFNFFSRFDMPLAKDVEDGIPFGFTLGPFKWSVITDFKNAMGNWANTDGPEIPKIPPLRDGEGEGTFQVQTGGHVVESVSSASA